LTNSISHSLPKTILLNPNAFNFLASSTEWIFICVEACKTKSKYSVTTCGNASQVYFNQFSYYQGTDSGSLYSDIGDFELKISESANKAPGNGYAVVSNLNAGEVTPKLAEVYQPTKVYYKNIQLSN
jgi:hypothetical protein